MSLLANTEHLNPEASEALSLSQGERVHYIKSPRWIGYPVAQDILKKMEDLLAHPQTSRMPNMLIVGDTNNGKTTIIERFVNKNPAYESADKQYSIIPALMIQCPPVPSEARLYSNILEKLFAPYKFTDPVEKKQYQVFKLLRSCGVKMLILDEIHSVLSGRLELQRIFLSAIRNISNEIKIPIVGVGTKEALRAVKTDPQLDNRFKPELIPRWKNDDSFRRLLMSFERMLPLKSPSLLANNQIATKLFAMSEGYIGELSEILKLVSAEAVISGEEQINLRLLEKMNWYSPSERKKQR